MLPVVSRTWDLLLDFVYPPRCGGCDKRGTLFCGDCLMLMAPPPDDVQDVAGITELVCAGAYQDPLRTAIHKLKYKSDTPLAKPLANFLYEAISMSALWDTLTSEGDPPAIMFVPLHRDKQRSRGFNQSQLIARELSRLSGWPLQTGLTRVRNTPSQVRLDKKERQANVKDAFAWEGGQAPGRVLLVDDVCTTGSTISQCASVLARAGTDRVFAATVARATGSQFNNR